MQARLPRALRLHLASALCVMLPAQLLPRASAADWSDGVLVSTFQTLNGSANVQLMRPASSDILVVWRAMNNNTYSGLAQRLTIDGAIAPGWSAQGTLVTGGSNVGFIPFPAVHDGGGGVLVAHAPAGNVYLVRAPGDGSAAVEWPVATTAANETRPGIAGDGAGGAYVSWVVTSSGYLGRFLSDGSPAPGWPAAGLILPSSATESPALDGDGAGGAYVLWTNSQARVLRVTSSGAIAAGWPEGGLALGPAYSGLGSIRPVRLFPSGEGRIAVWFDLSILYDIALMRFLPDGTLDPVWPEGGLRVSSNSFGPIESVSDGQGGVTVAQEEYDVPYVTHVLSNGNPVGGGSPLDAGAQYVPASGYPTFALATGPDGGVIFAWNDTRPSRPGVRVRWLRADGTPDPTEPDTCRVIGPASIRGAIDDGNGGAYLAWDRNHLLHMSRLLAPALVGVGPRPAPPPALGLHAIAPNPASRAVSVRVMLTDGAPAILELLDLAGRRLRARTLTGAGERTERFEGLEAIAPGIYVLRITQGRASRSARLAIVR